MPCHLSPNLLQKGVRMSSEQRSDAEQLAEFGYKQELHRTLGSFSSFAAGFSYISILTGMFQTSYLGFLFAGPAFIWAWLVVLFGQMMVALQFAELSAHYPLAGSVYQWSKQVAGKAWAWNTGWVYLCAQIVTVPAVALAWQVILPQISTQVPGVQVLAQRHLSGSQLPAVQQPGLRQERDPAGHRHDHADDDHQRARASACCPGSTTSALRPSWSAPAVW